MASSRSVGHCIRRLLVFRHITCWYSAPVVKSQSSKLSSSDRLVQILWVYKRSQTYLSLEAVLAFSKSPTFTDFLEIAQGIFLKYSFGYSFGQHNGRIEHTRTPRTLSQTYAYPIIM